jgi:chromosome segregation ATPase
VKDQPARTGTGFVDQYTAQVDRLKQLVADLKVAEKRLTDLQQQRAGYQKVLDDRAAQLKTAAARLVDARKETFRSAQASRVLQDQLHRALTDLADVETDIDNLEAQIERATGVTRRPAPKRKGATP